MASRRSTTGPSRASISGARRRLVMPSSTDHSDARRQLVRGLFPSNQARSGQSFSSSSTTEHEDPAAPSSRSRRFPSLDIDQLSTAGIASSHCDGCDGFVEPFNDEPALDQVPAAPTDGNIEHVTIPVVSSPTKNDIRPSLSEQRSHRRHDASHLRAEIISRYAKGQKRFSPAKTICVHLRDHLVAAKYKELETFGVPKTGSSICSAGNNWYMASRDKQGGSSMRPFLSLSSVLEGAPCPLTYDMGRMWFEDFVLLKEDEDVTMLIHPTHHILTGRGKTETKCLHLEKTMIERMLQASPYSLVRFGERRYFAVKMRVKSNPKQRDFEDGTLTRKDLSDILKVSAGCGITFESMANCKISNDDSVETVRFTIFYVNALERPLDLMFWKPNYEGSKRISDVKRVMEKLKDHVRVASVVEVYKDFVFGDRLQSYALYNCAQSKISKKESELEFENYKNSTISDKRFRSHLVVASNDVGLCSFKTYVDEICRVAIDNLYGRFSTFASPILSQTVLMNFTNQFKVSLPTQYKAILTLIGKDDNKERVVKNKWLWDRYSFFLYCMFIRIRDPSNLTWWAMINAASEYGRGGNSIPSFFGFSSSYRTLLRSLNSLCPFSKIYKRTVETLQPLEFVVATFDNSQLIQQRKFQRNGKSSSATIVTSRMFVRAMESPALSLIRFDEIPSLSGKVDITYLGQAIPSPYGLPAFELLGDDRSPDIFNETKWITNSSSLDFTGRRVETYASVIVLGHRIARLSKLIPFWTMGFNFQCSDHVASMEKLGVKARMKVLMRKGSRRQKRGFIRRIVDFQRHCTYSWRRGGKIDPVAALVPPVSPDDETTNIGAGQNVVSLLLMRGILEGVDSRGVDGDVTKVKLADDYKNKWLMLVGDGLTQIRVKTFVDLIQRTSFDFGKQQETTEMIRKALGQVIHVTGDLHGGLFHFLSSIYSLFYGCLIQPVQEVVAWKRICGTDVTKCYQQAAGLAMIISTEMERQLIALFVHDMVINGGWLDTHNFERYSNECGGDNDDVQVESISPFYVDAYRDANRAIPSRFNPKKQLPPALSVEEKIAESFAVDLVDAYSKWLDTKRRNTTDEVFRMALNYVELVSYYREFRLAMAAGDAVMIEHLYKVFLPIFHYTGKKHYFGIVCDMMDQMYNGIDQRLLHLTRVNRTHPLYRGRDVNGRHISDQGIDTLIEIGNKIYNKMNFKNDLEGWKRHSPHMQMQNKCHRFAQNEFTRVFSDEGKLRKNGGGEAEEIDPNRNRKESSKPGRKDEHCIVAEFLKVNNICNEVANRCYSRRSVYENMKEIKTKFGDEEAEARSRWLDDAASKEEQHLSNAIQQLFDSGSNASSSSDSQSTNAVTTTVDISENEETNVIMAFESIAFLDADAEETETGEGADDLQSEEATGDSENASSNVVEKDGFLTTTMGNKRRIRLRPAKISMKPFRDIITEASSAIEKLNLKENRLRRNHRAKKQDDRKRRILQGIRTNDENIASKTLLQEGMDRLKNRQRSSPLAAHAPRPSPTPDPRARSPSTTPASRALPTLDPIANARSTQRLPLSRPPTHPRRRASSNTSHTQSTTTTTSESPSLTANDDSTSTSLSTQYDALSVSPVTTDSPPGSAIVTTSTNTVSSLSSQSVSPVNENPPWKRCRM